ncbi:MAG: hypothetical protein KGI38_03800 [Thaumarchaeota archaeon]|nr:hypothetical protein [Nitrososphaerota archaeon]
MVSRETKEVGVAPSSGVSGREVVNRAVKSIDPDATIYHDDYRSCGILDGSFRRESVDHGTGECAEGGAHEHDRGRVLGHQAVAGHLSPDIEGARLPLLNPPPTPQEHER